MISMTAVRCIACVFAASLPLGLSAATKTTTFQVRLNLVNDCSITANDLDFGSHGVLTTNLDQSTTLGISCTSGTAYAVGLDAGSASGSSVASRFLTGPASSTVIFQLFRDTARAQIWGNTLATDTVSGTGNGTAQTIPVYGRVPPQSTPAAGAYTSTVTATITF